MVGTRRHIALPSFVQIRHNGWPESDFIGNFTTLRPPFFPPSLRGSNFLSDATRKFSKAAAPTVVVGNAATFSPLNIGQRQSGRVKVTRKILRRDFTEIS